MVFSKPGYKYPMDDKPHLPDGWAMPKGLANQVEEELNKKPITPEDKLQDALGEIARDMAIIESNPLDWRWWVIFLLEKMEVEAGKKGKRDEFKMLLNSLDKDILSLID